VGEAHNRRKPKELEFFPDKIRTGDAFLAKNDI